MDVRRGRIVHRAEVGGPARHVSIAPNGRALWTALGTKAPRIAVLDTSRAARPRLRRTVTPPFLAHDVGFEPTGERVWVTSGERGAVALYAPDSDRPARIIAADAAPQHVAFDGDAGGRRAFVTSGDDGTLRVHDAREGSVLRAARVPRGSYNVTFGWTRVLTPSLDAGTLCQLSRAGRVLATRRLARAAHDSCVASGA